MTVHDNDSTTPTESTTSRYTSSSGYAGTRVFNSQTFVGGTGAQMKAGPSRSTLSRRRWRTIRPKTAI